MKAFERVVPESMFVGNVLEQTKIFANKNANANDLITAYATHLYQKGLSLAETAISFKKACVVTSADIQSATNQIIGDVSAIFENVSPLITVNNRIIFIEETTIVGLFQFTYGSESKNDVRISVHGTDKFCAEINKHYEQEDLKWQL